MSSSRTRSREDTPSIGSITVVPNYALIQQGHVQTTTSNEGLSYRFAEVISDVVTPNFKRLIAEGRIINNPYSYSKSQRDTIPGVMTFVYKEATDDGVPVFDYYGHLCQRYVEKFEPVFVHAPQDHATSILDVKRTAIARIDPADFNFAEDAGELRETLQFLQTALGLLKAPLFEIHFIAKKINRASKKLQNQGYHNAKALSSAYLQYRFAMTPLVKSVTDIITAMDTAAKKRSPRYNARAKVIKPYTSTSVVDVQNGWVFTQEITSETTYRANIMYSSQDSYMTWQRKLGFRLKDLPVTAWNLTPLSFMVDRLFDVSTMMKGMTNLADSELRILAASSSIKQVTTVKTSLLVGYTDYRGGYNGGGNAGSYEDTDVSIDREVWHPSVLDTIPELTFGKLVSDAKSITDIVALTMSFLK
jgi:hypothetical protein